MDLLRSGFPGRPCAPLTGATGGGGGAWAQTTVQGTMYKARCDQPINPAAWDRLKQFYPAFFKGDRIAPDWA